MKTILLFTCTFLMMHAVYGQQNTHFTKEQLSNLPYVESMDDSMINGSSPYYHAINAELLSTEKKKNRVDLTNLSVIRYCNMFPVMPDQLNPNKVVIHRDELNKLPASNLIDIIRLLDTDRFFTQW